MKLKLRFECISVIIFLFLFFFWRKLILAKFGSKIMKINLLRITEVMLMTGNHFLNEKFYFCSFFKSTSGISQSAISAF